MRSDRRFLLVTSGDADGVGLEVIAKALHQLPKSFFYSVGVCVFISDRHQSRYVSFLKKKFSVLVINTNSRTFTLDLPKIRKTGSRPPIYLVHCSDQPPDWIFQLSKLCMKFPKRAALVTGPLSKTLIKSSGYSAIGHTELMAQATLAAPLFMGFVGKYFNVVLLTGHIPVAHVSSELKNLNWNKMWKMVGSFSKNLTTRKRPMALVGLNPHAGEKGLISTGEDDYLAERIKEHSAKVHGPMVPDAAFLKQNWSRYSLFLTCYHDQGLIPFKAVHGQDSGVHVTIGLPFVRTSVDHGTAKEIFGKDKANPNSMKEALVLAKRLLA